MGRAARWVMVAAMAVAGAVAGAVVVPGPASAHSDLADVQPAAESAVKEGTVVTLTFTGDVLDIGAEAVVTDASGASAVVPVSFPTTQSISITMPALAEGAVSFAWRVVAEDGHPIEGVLAYVADAPASEGPTSAEAPSSSAGPIDPATPAASAAPTPTTPTQGPVAVDPDPDVPVAVWVALVAALIAAFSVTLAARKR